MVTLNHPTQGNTNWFTPVDSNWTTIENSLDQSVCQGRLTLATGTPVTISDVTGASAATVYFTPYVGNRVAVYNGSTWIIDALSEISLSLSTIASGNNYDVFVYDNSGTLTLELSAAWTNATTRADSLALQDGIRVKSANHTRRYLGTLRGAAAGQSEDSKTKRFLINYYHRCLRPLSVNEATASWTWNSSTYHQANASATNQVEYISNGEDAISAEVLCMSVLGANSDGTIGIGIDSTSIDSSQIHNGSGGSTSLESPLMARYCGTLAEGYHAIKWLEVASAGTVTFYSAGGFRAGDNQSGLVSCCMG